MSLRRKLQQCFKKACSFSCIYMYLLLLQCFGIPVLDTKPHPPAASEQVPVPLVRYPVPHSSLDGVLPPWGEKREGEGDERKDGLVTNWRNYTYARNVANVYRYMYIPSSSTALSMSICQSAFHSQPSGHLISSRVSSFSDFPSYSFTGSLV